MNQPNTTINCAKIKNQENAIFQTRKKLGRQAKELTTLQQKQPSTSTAIQWQGLALTIRVPIKISTWPIWAAAATITASGQHLLIAPCHETAHYRLSHSRIVNDGMDYFLLAIIIFMFASLAARPPVTLSASRYGARSLLK